jgi:hypothetical protein
VVQLDKDPCQGIVFRRADKLGDSITRAAQLFDTPRSGAKSPSLSILFRTAEVVAEKLAFRAKKVHLEKTSMLRAPP